MTVQAVVAAQRSGLGDTDLDVEGVRLVPVPSVAMGILGSNIQAITLRRTIAVNPNLFDNVVGGAEPELLAHELIHVSQWAQHGVVPFLWRYISDYVRLRLVGADHDTAYRGIGFEHAAYRGAAAIVSGR